MQFQVMFVTLIVIYIVISVCVDSTYAQTLVIIKNGASSPSNFESYSPSYIEVGTGASVSWRNDDSITHSVTFVDPKLKDHMNPSNTDLVEPAKSITYTFNAPGIYDYYCKLFPFMAGRVSVK